MESGFLVGNFPGAPRRRQHSVRVKTGRLPHEHHWPLCGFDDIAQPSVGGELTVGGIQENLAPYHDVTRSLDMAQSRTRQTWPTIAIALMYGITVKYE